VFRSFKLYIKYFSHICCLRTNDSKCIHEIKYRIARAKVAMRQKTF